MSTIWYVVEDENALATLQGLTDEGTCDYAVMALGDKDLAEAASHGAARVCWIDPQGAPTERFVGVAADAIEQSGPTAVIGVATPAARTVVGKVAAKFECAIASSAVKVVVGDDTCTVTRSICDDGIIEECKAAGCVCVLVNPLLVKEGMTAPAGEACAVERLNVQPSFAIERTGIEPVEATAVESAERVIGIGIGAASPDMLAKAKELADKIGAEVGGSMNAVEHTDLFPGQRYIGLSGVKIAPKLYLALGVAGAAQHLAGIRNAKTVAVVNKDPKANFFDHADYGIVGDVEEVVPALIKAL